MKKKIIYALVIFLSIMVQTSSAAFFSNSNWLVDVVLMLVLAWTLIDGFDLFLPWAIFAGILYDLVAFSPIGLHVIIFSLLAYCVSFFSKRFSTEIKGMGILLVMFFTAAATIGSRAIIFFWEFGDGFFANDFSNFWMMVKFFIPVFFYNLIIFFILYFVIGWIKKFFYLSKKEERISV